MADFTEDTYHIFELFHTKWGLVTAGDLGRFNACTISWGSLGTLWTRPEKSGQVVTIYIHPARYTHELLIANDTFTVSFFSENYRKDLAYLGSHSGKEADKMDSVSLTPMAMDDSVGYKEAEITFLCKKLYQHSFAKEGIIDEVQEYYQSHPKSYPTDANGEWQPHWMFIGEIIRVEKSQVKEHHIDE